MYSTYEEIRPMIKEDMINAIIGNEFIEELEEKERLLMPIVEQAVIDADAEIDGYLNKKYDVPFLKPPTVINKLSKDIAIYNLISRMGIDESEREKTYKTRYDAAIAFLLNVAKGTIDIGINDSKANANSGFQINSSKRLFSRENMRGF